MALSVPVAVLAPLAIGAPILGACLLLTVGRRVPRRLVDGTAVAVAALVLALDVLLLVRSAGDPAGHLATWIGGWGPGSPALGIALVADPFAAGAAVIAAALTVAALVYTWHYLDSAEAHFHALLLLFLAGMTGFVLSGDLFDMFVFFELMGAVAYALTGFRVEEPTSVQGALAFGVVNSFGAYVTLTGIGVLYAQTGQLGLAPLAVALQGRPPGAVVVGGFVLVVTGFCVKAALVPFHFWLDDAHAVAPTPVCVLFSGIMVELGLYGVFRVTTVVFGPVLPHADLQRTFLVLGTLTALLGAVLCFLQRHLKRLLAYSTIAHVGLFTIAFGTLDPAGTAGAALYVAGHAATKSALFLVAGSILDRYGSVDEIDLHGAGRRARVLPWLMLLGGFALAGLPPFGSGLGKAVSEEAVAEAGAPWAPALFVLVSAVTGAAVLRAACRIYFGLGSRPDKDTAPLDTKGSEEAEVKGLLKRVPATMLGPLVVLLAGGLVLGVLPGVPQAFAEAADHFLDRAGYLASAFGTAAAPAAPSPASGWTTSGVVLGLVSSALAALLALAALYRDRLPGPSAVGRRIGDAVVARLRGLHSGHIGDYITWLLVGVALLGALVGLPLLAG
ncbi:complex I subunit 5 family protein [Pseudonocardia sp. RS11V-5]|uniref:complex I subunit 5 family protein n=1 Tax=Pseudonocardia terrae TaxID=2905831 RepID=UPI001E5B805B|nr:complex I subunit 5 family protein [Pseudonocardia terrae]MCE3553269.1 complex I subunit 5 family protein [Pseudonocardia terrae]